MTQADGSSTHLVIFTALTTWHKLIGSCYICCSTFTYSSWLPFTIAVFCVRLKRSTCVVLLWVIDMLFVQQHMSYTLTQRTGVCIGSRKFLLALDIVISAC